MKRQMESLSQYDSGLWSEDIIMMNIMMNIMNIISLEMLLMSEEKSGLQKALIYMLKFILSEYFGFGGPFTTDGRFKFTILFYTKFLIISNQLIT